MSAPEFRLIAVDIDGTLIATNGTILPGTRAEFARARAAGAKIALVSGRPIVGLRRLIHRMVLDGTADVLVGYNGSHSEFADGTPVASHRLDADVASSMAALCLEHGVLPMLCSGDSVLTCDPTHPWVVFEAEGNGMTIASVPDVTALDAPVHKLLMRAEPAVLRPFAEVFAAHFGSSSELAFSAPFYFEATAAGVDKGTAITDLEQALGITPDQVVSFGDNENDLPMLRAAGLGVAMGNALPRVLAAADRVTASNDDEGIARVLADLFGAGQHAPAVPTPDGVQAMASIDFGES